MLRPLSLIAVLLVVLSSAVTAIAQEKGPNGGLVAGKGSHKTELVVSPTELVVYLLEDGRVHESTGTTMRAVIQQSGKTTTINLADQGGKRLVGRLAEPAKAGAIIVLSGRDHHGDALSARYVLK
jgi:hypothetical protein